MKRIINYIITGKIRNNPLFRGFLIAFLFVMFILGLYFYTTQNIPSITQAPINFLPAGLQQLLENFENDGSIEGERNESPGPSKTFDSTAQPPEPNQNNCPDVLIRRGAGLTLYNSKDPSIPPIQFENIQDYQTYLEKQKTQGNNCPILYIQEETNTQGENVYRIRPTLDNSENALPVSLAATGRFLVEQMPLNSNQPNLPQIYKTLRDNEEDVSSFDPTSQNIGRFTIMDKKHIEEEITSYKSANPLHSNWGGKSFSQTEVDSGRYAGSYVTRPVFPKI